MFFLVCDGLKGLPEVVANAWPLTIVQTCLIHLLCKTFRLSSKRDWDALKRDIKPIYTAVNPDAARVTFEAMAQTWGHRYAAIDHDQRRISMPRPRHHHYPELGDRPEWALRCRA